MKITTNSKFQKPVIAVHEIPVGTVFSGKVSGFIDSVDSRANHYTMIRTARGIVALCDPRQTWTDDLANLSQLWIHEYVEYPNVELVLHN